MLPHPISFKVNFNMNNPSVPRSSFQMSLLYACYILCQSYPPFFLFPTPPPHLFLPFSHRGNGGGSRSGGSGSGNSGSSRDSNSSIVVVVV